MANYPVNMAIKPEVTAFFDPATNTISYVVKDPQSASCAIIDSVMDIDYAAGRISYVHADEIIAHVGLGRDRDDAMVATLAEQHHQGDIDPAHLETLRGMMTEEVRTAKRLLS